MSEIQIKLEGWKGKDKIQIYKEDDVFIVIEHRKSKETSEVDATKHTIPKENVEFIYELLKDMCKEQKKQAYKDIIMELISRKKWSNLCDRDNFNGGRNRASFYFPHYYYPIKILEYFGKLQYFGRGGILLFD